MGDTTLPFQVAVQEVNGRFFFTSGWEDFVLAERLAHDDVGFFVIVGPRKICMRVYTRGGVEKPFSVRPVGVDPDSAPVAAPRSKCAAHSVGCVYVLSATICWPRLRVVLTCCLSFDSSPVHSGHGVRAWAKGLNDGTHHATYASDLGQSRLRLPTLCLLPDQEPDRQELPGPFHKRTCNSVLANSYAVKILVFLITTKSAFLCM